MHTAIHSSRLNAFAGHQQYQNHPRIRCRPIGASGIESIMVGIEPIRESDVGPTRESGGFINH